MIRPLICFVGAGVIALALAANDIGLSQAAHFSYGQFLLVTIGVFVLLIGIFLRNGKTGSSNTVAAALAASYTKTAIILTNTVMLFFCIEIGTIGYMKAQSRFFASIEHNPVNQQRQLSYYRSQSWGASYWNEFSRLKNEYAPYVIWQRRAFRGKLINIDGNGIRRTPGSDCRTGSYKVFAFGGSTMWGSGSPDWGTIPAYLQGGLQNLEQKAVCVTNFGETAYVSTQGVIRLLLALQSGIVPDAVIFYDGVNDVYAAYQSAKPAVHQNLGAIAAKFNDTNGDQRSANWPKLYITSLLSKMVGKMRTESQPYARNSSYEAAGVSADLLGRQIAETLFHNYRIVAALGAQFNFRYYFFLQPVIVIGEKLLTSEERDIKLKLDPALVKLYAMAYPEIMKANHQQEQFYNLAPIFDRHKPLVWIDFNHVTPEGNQLIAREILRSFRH